MAFISSICNGFISVPSVMCRAVTCNGRFPYPKSCCATFNIMAPLPALPKESNSL